MSRTFSILRQQKGSATVEFALVSVFFFGIIVVGLDFGIYTQKNLKLGNAVEQASIVAFDSRSTKPVVDTNQISTYITTVVGGSPTITIMCNGAATCNSSAPASKCIGAPATSGGWPTFTDPTANGGTACTNGSSPGYYVVIRAAQTFNSVVVPDKYLNNGTMQQQAVVRLS